MKYNELESSWNLLQPFNKLFYFCVFRVKIMQKDKASYFDYRIKAIRPKRKVKILISYLEDVIPFIEKLKKEIEKGKYA
jgi:hypothetical protein